MANAKEIQNRIKSIQDTMKITKAMYMISSTKLRKAKQSLEDTEPFFYTIQTQISRILRHMPEMEHIYFDSRPKDLTEAVKKRGFLVVTADKGMAGAYNHNILKIAQEKCEESDEYHLYVIGELGRQYFTGHDMPIDETFLYTAQNPTLGRARRIADTIIDLYLKEELDEVYIIYTRMLNSITEEVAVDQLLPLKREDFSQKIPSEILMETYQEEFKMWPSPKAVIESLVPNYLAGFTYGALVESYASEQNARMLAMQASTDSATAMLHELSIMYNRVRQAAITQEITEVVGGARALKRKKKVAQDKR